MKLTTRAATGATLLAALLLTTSGFSCAGADSPEVTGYFCKYAGGLDIADVTVPSAPRLLGNYSGAVEAEGVVIEGDLAFISNIYYGFQIVDVSDPANPTLRYEHDRFCYHVSPHNGFAYVGSGAYGLYVFDVGDLENVREVAHIATGDSLGGSSDVQFTWVGDREIALVCDGRAGAMVVDITDPQAITRLGWIRWGAVDYNHHVTRLGCVGSLVLACTPSGLGIANISDLSNPSTWCKAFYQPAGWLYDITIVGNHAFLAANERGLIVLDISDPLRPQEVGRWSLPPGAPPQTLGYRITVAGQRAYLAARASGFYILDISNPGTPVLVGQYAPGGAWGYDSAIVLNPGTPLSITPPTDLVASTNPEACEATELDLGQPAVTGGVGAVTVANDALATFAKGVTRVTWTATDEAGNIASAAQSITVVDEQPPALVQPADITVPATSPVGAVVFIPDPGASDNCGVVSVDFDPASGSTFPIGITEVLCTATDDSGNVTPCTFTVRIQGAPEQITDLIATVDSLVLHHGIERSLFAKLEAAQAALSQGDAALACVSLQALVQELEAQAGKKLTTLQAEALIRESTRIRAVIGCDPQY